MWVGIIKSFEGLKRTKRQRREEFACFLLLVCLLSWDIGLLLPLNWDLYHWLLWFQAFGLGLELLELPAFLGLQLADSSSWDFSPP